MNGALSDFWYCLNSNILVSSEGISTLQISLFLHAFLCDSSLQEWKQFKMQGKTKSLWCLEVIPVNNADSFFGCKIMPSLPSFGLSLACFSVWNH